MLLDNQVGQLENQAEANRPSLSGQRTTRILLLAFVLAFGLTITAIALQYQVSDPYTKTVLSINGDAVQGHAIFQMNCAGCHGPQGKGQVGPSLHNVAGRKSRPQIIHQVISGQTPPMPQFKPTTQEMADLLSYVEKL